MSTESVGPVGRNAFPPEQRYRWLYATIVLAGVLTPWIVGIAIKLWLDTIGEPTWPWSFFFDFQGLAAELLMTVWVAFPFIGLAMFAAGVLTTRSFFGLEAGQRILMLCTGLLAGIVAAAVLFYGIFYPVFDPFFGLIQVFLAPFEITVVILAGCLIGIGIGCLLAWIRGAALPRGLAH